MPLPPPLLPSYSTAALVTDSVGPGNNIGLQSPSAMLRFANKLGIMTGSEESRKSALSSDQHINRHLQSNSG